MMLKSISRGSGVRPSCAHRTQPHRVRRPRGSPRDLSDTYIQKGSLVCSSYVRRHTEQLQHCVSFDCGSFVCQEPGMLIRFTVMASPARRDPALHARLRRWSAPAFRGDNLRAAGHALEGEMSDLVERVRHDSKDGASIDVFRLFRLLSLDM